MTLIRRLALKITGFVVTHASPGSKEWAKALAREVDFIESDWSALAWAFGSMRVLFDYRPAPIRSLADLTVAAQKFAEKRRHAVNDVWLATNMRWLGFLTPILAFMFLSIIDSKHRAGYGLIVIGSLLQAIYGFIQCKEPVVPDRDDVNGMVRFYKTELERICRLFDFWLFIVGALIVGIGAILPKPSGWGFYFAALAWFNIFPLGLFLQLQRNNRRRLQQIKALLDEKE